MRSSQSGSAVVLGVPRVRPARPAPPPAPPSPPSRASAIARAPEPEIDVVVELEPTPVRAPIRAAAPVSVRTPAPVSVRVNHAAHVQPSASVRVNPSGSVRLNPSASVRVSTPPVAYSLPTPVPSYPPPAASSRNLLTPSEGVALPPRSEEQANALVWLTRVARSIPTRVAEHLVTFGVATFSFAFLAAVIATFGGSDALPQTKAAAEQPRAGYTRPTVEKLSTGAPQQESNLAAAQSPLHMMQVKAPSRVVTINRVTAAAAPAQAEAARRAAALPPPPPPVADDAIPAEREPVAPKAAPVVASPPAARPVTPPARPRTAPSQPKEPKEPKADVVTEPRVKSTPDPKPTTESGMAQRALEEARHEDTSLSGH